MIIGIPKEIKVHEYRVGVTPAGVRELREEGHRVIMERSAGEGSGFADEDYRRAGAELLDKTSLFRESELIVKVKEPLSSEYEFLREGQALFTFLHLAANPELADFLLRKKITALAYETLEENGTTPLLAPMSEIAGRMAPVVGAFYLQKVYGGRGVLLTGIEGGEPARVCILGAGTVGSNALRVATGMGAEVTVISKGEEKLEHLKGMYGNRVRFFTVTESTVTSEVLSSDVVIGAVMVTGARTPILISRETVSQMKKGSVIVDVSVDQGGCADTTRPTTHTDPVYTVDGIIHYAVANMPGAYPRTSTLALVNRTITYIKLLAGDGIERAIRNHAPLKSALNIHGGNIVHEALAGSLS